MEAKELRVGQEKFTRLLRSPEYERLRGGLIRLFARRGCTIPEDLADETFSRVVAKLPDVAIDYEGEPARFFYAVARNVYLEYTRRPRLTPLDDTADATAAARDEPAGEAAFRCLDGCVETLAPEDRELIQRYYLHDKSAKIDGRKHLATELGIGMNALRIKAFRIRVRLQDCVSACLGSEESE